ncbi:3-dehydroquinate synthase [Flavobacterium amnicola]|uniref:3-dehydroquinate synthase n=1 Tax=Flavobacterium amnicola TaxID=2506422 RepID=A0A4Q1K075_9FLAO|nr:3-dehydroquinate synthase [Flavobacterium amnicola]RXR17275.1 3-dehydroquinate synthase [Flavobacterium amnicola]
MVTNPIIHFNKGNYEALNRFLATSNFSKIFIIVDENTNEFCLPKLLPLLETESEIEIIELEAGEENKTIETCIGVWEALIELGADRKSIILNLGGGVVTDMGGFIAATFKRGIPFINIPTTLLAMVDASVGGKNGIDLGGLKNQIGTITNPEMIVIDVEYLETLSQRELKSGLAEMLKHGLIADKKHWNLLKDFAQFDFSTFEKIIEESVNIKNNIVSQDPTENGIRKALNFGHTLGHAIETYLLENPTKEKILHGEAIACGMILESFISVEKGLLSPTEYSEIKNALNSIFERILFTENDINSVLKLLIHDKKNEYGQIQFALLNGIGGCNINQTTDNETIINAFKDYN